MCLIINKETEDTQINPMTAQEDITVWKVYRVSVKELNSKDDIDYLYSPYRLKYTRMGDQPEVEMKSNHYTSPIESYGYVEEGYHSVKNLEDAWALKIHLDESSICDEIVVMKCIIPKGSKFYQGTFRITYAMIKFDCYASNNLRVLERKIQYYEKEVIK